jgi:hypothetical protein
VPSRLLHRRYRTTAPGDPGGTVILGGPYSTASATVALPEGSWGVRIAPGSAVFKAGTAQVTVQGTTTGGDYTGDWTGHCFPISNAADAGVNVTWLGTVPKAWTISSTQAPQELMVISAVPNIVHSSTGLVKLSMTQPTPVIEPPAYGYTYLYGVTFSAPPSTLPFLLQANESDSFDLAEVVAPARTGRVDYMIPRNLNLLGDNGLWIGPVSADGCSAIANYTVGNAP